ncbi:MAG: hypothetical protein IPK26_21340 [Planctomycetes bacterium]|nr:hypothetical protein [Planctomycetota bacterium]
MADAQEQAPRRIRFGWPDTQEQLAAFGQAFPDAVADPMGRAFVAGAARLWLPFLLPTALPGERVAAYTGRVPERIGRHGVLILQAGAAALGYWDEDELLRHRAIKKYVVRGQGKAQPTHKKTRGKSRYGSRLRLQNWQRLMVQTNEKLAGWWDELGAPEQVFFAIPVRSRAELWAVTPPPPFPRDGAGVRRIPLHVHVPDHQELLRVRRWLGQGRLEVPN